MNLSTRNTDWMVWIFYEPIYITVHTDLEDKLTIGKIYNSIHNEKRKIGQYNMAGNAEPETHFNIYETISLQGKHMFYAPLKYQFEIEMFLGFGVKGSCR